MTSIATPAATSTAPDYSIVVPTYRRREPLARCLAAINALDYPRDRFELVVVDDGSPSPPEDLLGTLDGDVAARLVCAEHGGPAAARNLGASLARGAYLAFTDDDCAPRPDWLRAVHRAVQAADDGAAIGGRTINVLADDLFATASQGMVDYLYEYFGSDRRPGHFFTSNNLVVPRADFLALGGFDVRFARAAAEDRDLCERWSRSGRRLVYAPDAVVGHAHAMGFRRFNRMHFNYGRGAFDLHRSRARRGDRSLKVEPVRFYSGLVMHPLRASRGGRGVVLALLNFWSQVVYAAGYFYERVKRGWTVDTPL
ncbi:MAG TPA: glycosyltransferase [Gemmatimonadaceae bacterium]|nr:glycosyltransferase [Gemmatimonadaceae bacterium]